MMDIEEQLKYDPDLEAKYLDRALVFGGVPQAHFASEGEFFSKNSKFYTDVIPSEYSLAISDRFWNIFSSEMNLFTNTAVDVMHTKEGLLRMDVSCGALIITFEIDTNANSGVVSHRGMCKESLEVSSWKEYPHKDIFLLGNAVFGNYFWGNGC